MKASGLWMVAGLLALGLAVLLFWLRPASPEKTMATVAPVAAPTPVGPVAGAAGQADEQPIVLPQASWALQPADVPITLPEALFSVEASESMAQARLQGDDRAPPIQHTPAAQPLATAAQKADPAAYARYETQNNQRLYQAYVSAATQAIPDLERDIARARAEGLSPEQIAEGEEKLRRIKAMQQELLQKHPELTLR